VLFQAHALSLARLALLMLGDQAEAQDVVDEIRDALREAGRLREVRPLRLEPAPYRRAASARPRRALLRWAWLAPVTAAALVIAVAIALATVRTQQNGPAVPALPQSSAARTTVPEYYALLYAPGGLTTNRRWNPHRRHRHREDAGHPGTRDGNLVRGDNGGSRRPDVCRCHLSWTQTPGVNVGVAVTLYLPGSVFWASAAGDVLIVNTSVSTKGTMSLAIARDGRLTPLPTLPQPGGPIVAAAS
jgi:hypothetical protein